MARGSCTGWRTSYSAPSGKIYVVSATGSTPVQVQPGFADARYPIWTRDGKHILF